MERFFAVEDMVKSTPMVIVYNKAIIPSNLGLSMGACLGADYFFTGGPRKGRRRMTATRRVLWVGRKVDKHFTFIIQNSLFSPRTVCYTGLSRFLPMCLPAAYMRINA